MDLSVVIFSATVSFLLKFSEGAGCNDYTGAVIRDYDFDYTTGSISNAGDRLARREHGAGARNTEFIMNNTAVYTVDCACGAVTMWQFYAWQAGTVIFYVLDGTEVKGKTSVTIGEQSIQNFFEVPLSSDMWIPVQSGYNLGFFTSGQSMITFRPSGGNNMYFTRNTVEKNVGEHVSASGTSRTNRLHAVAAYVIEAHPPMFVNAPYETTVYTHDTNTVVYTAVMLDLDGTDIVSVTDLTANAAFVFDTNALTLTYISKIAEGQYTITLQASDGCPSASHTVTAQIIINLINEGPVFNNLPASTTVNEAETSTRTLYTLAPTDASGDTVTCSIDSVDPAAGTGIFSLSGYGIVQVANPNYTYSTAKYYELKISCTDGQTTRDSNFQVDVIKNEQPYFNTGTGYLPASIYVDRSSGVSIYQLDFADAEGGSVTAVACGTCGGTFDVSSSGEVTTQSVLDDEAYDLSITINDGHQNAEPKILSVVTSGRPYTFNAAPAFVNLDTTQYVMEHTAVGTFLFRVLYTDENPSDTFTLAKDSVSSANVDTYFAFDTATGAISVKADINFENTGSGGWEMRISINDGSQTQHTTVTGTVTFTIVNINEDVTLAIGNPAIAADETMSRGAVFTDPAIVVTDVDSSDTYYITMDCGSDSKYFYMDTATEMIHFAREYDMDSGLSGTATCNISVRDEGGLYDSGLVTLTVNNINDHSPKFPNNFYVFLVSTSTPFFTELANMAASDADSDSFGSTNGVLTYHFDPASPTEDFFQIDSAGILFVRNLTTYTGNRYVFSLVATDSGGLTGTCTVTVIFTGVAITTTTTTERALVFKDDYKNYFWLLLVSAALFVTLVVIVLMVWKDPVVNDYVGYKMYKLCEWCRRTPKPKEPKRSVAKLTVTVNKKKLENDPDNALPWELMAKGTNEPELRELVEISTEKKSQEYTNSDGLPVFEKGKGVRPASSSSWSSGRKSESPKYATFVSTDVGQNDDEIRKTAGGDGQWGEMSRQNVVHIRPTPLENNEDRNIVMTPVEPFEDKADESDADSSL